MQRKGRDTDCIMYNRVVITNMRTVVPPRRPKKPVLSCHAEALGMQGCDLQQCKILFHFLPSISMTDTNNIDDN